MKNSSYSISLAGGMQVLSSQRFRTEGALRAYQDQFRGTSFPKTRGSGPGRVTRAIPNGHFRLMRASRKAPPFRGKCVPFSPLRLRGGTVVDEVRGDQRGLDHSQDQAVIILNSPIRQPPLQTPRTASPKRRVGLVAVQDQDIPAPRWVQNLVALEPGAGRMDGLPKRLRVKLREDAVHRIRAGRRSSQTAPPARMRAALFQGMEAP